MNQEVMIQLITGALGSVSFGILFHIKNKYLPLSAFGGFLGWLIYLLGKGMWSGVFLPSLLLDFWWMFMQKSLQGSARKPPPPFSLPL